MSKSATIERHPVETPVGLRHLREDQRWWEGEGRGYTREFITAEQTFECLACHEHLGEKAFPTLTVPRQDGRKRGLVCRDCVDVRREANKKAAARKQSAAKAAATRAARRATKSLQSLLP